MIETKQKHTTDESEVLAKLAALGMSNKKAMDIVMLDLRQLSTAPAKFFVIASGNVPSHVNGIADGVFETIKKATGEAPRKMEGYDNAEWVLMDYFDVVVHVFQKEKRDFYRLEDLWADGIRTDYQPDEEIKEATAGTQTMKRTKAASAKAKAVKKARSNNAVDLKEDSANKRPTKKAVRKTVARTASASSRNPGTSSKDKNTSTKTRSSRTKENK